MNVNLNDYPILSASLENDLPWIPQGLRARKIAESPLQQLFMYKKVWMSNLLQFFEKVSVENGGLARAVWTLAFQGVPPKIR